MTDPAKPPNTARVDFPELLARVDNDHELLRDLLEIFRAEFPAQIGELESAIGRQDAREVAKLSHALKGMLANLAVTQSAASAGQLEQLARAGDIDSFEQAYTAFASDVRGLVAELESCMAGARR
jgi:HPt (histidine-containing phosphotransfer) domain-containing protein